jgi:hypothetical protein
VTRRITYILLLLVVSSPVAAESFFQKWKNYGGSTVTHGTSEGEKGNSSPPSGDVTAPIIVVPATINAVSETTKIVGNIVDENKSTSVMVDDVEVSVDDEGYFYAAIFVPVGGKHVLIKAKDLFGNISSRSIRLERELISKLAQSSLAKLSPVNVKGTKNKNAIAIIVGIEKYLHTPNAIYAKNDAALFVDFARKALGVPDQNIKWLSDANATRLELVKALRHWLPSISEQGKSDIFVFFAGHGLASANGQQLYLLPYDVDIDLLDDSAINRNDIISAIEEVKPRTATLFFDTCYSGGTRTKQSLVSLARGIRVTQKGEKYANNISIFSAAGNDQLSTSIPSIEHGLFSYFLMRGLGGEADANNDTKITNSELIQFLENRVPRHAIKTGRKQNPQFVGRGDRVLVLQ